MNLQLLERILHSQPTVSTTGYQIVLSLLFEKKAHRKIPGLCIRACLSIDETEITYAVVVLHVHNIN